MKCLSILADVGVGVLFLICLFAFVWLLDKLVTGLFPLFLKLRWHPWLKIYNGEKRVKKVWVTRTNFYPLLKTLYEPGYYATFEYNPMVEEPTLPTDAIVHRRLFLSYETNEVCMGCTDVLHEDAYYFLYLKFIDDEGLVDELHYYKIAKEYFNLFYDLDAIDPSAGPTFYDIADNLRHHYDELKDLPWFAMTVESDYKYRISKAELPIPSVLTDSPF